MHSERTISILIQVLFLLILMLMVKIIFLKVSWLICLNTFLLQTGILLIMLNPFCARIMAERCDFLVSIPMRGKLNSLNASAAAEILLYEAVRQRL